MAKRISSSKRIEATSELPEVFSSDAFIKVSRKNTQAHSLGLFFSYHPLGFAYFPDGAHANADELEPGIVPPDSSSTCNFNMTCPAPMYHISSQYKGVYSNNEDLMPLTIDEDNFGLDDYEPLFFHPLPEWVSYGEFSVFLKFEEDTDYNRDIFYFCHVSHFPVSALLKPISISQRECLYSLLRSINL